MSKDTKALRCPYYKSDTKQTICCEGIADNSVIQIRYTAIPEKLRYERLFCNGCFFRCPNAIMLNNKRKRYQIMRCKYNDGVECADTSRCKSCGWCPTVAQERWIRLASSLGNQA